MRCFLSMAVVVALSGSALGQTVVMQPAGDGIKKRYLLRIGKALAEAAGRLEGVSFAEAPLDALVEGADAAECALDAWCLAGAGAALGAPRVVGVSITRRGDSFDVTFVAVNAAVAEEVGRARHRLSSRELKTEAGVRLEDLVSGLPALSAEEKPAEPPAPPAPPDDAPPPVESQPAAVHPGPKAGAPPEAGGGAADDTATETRSAAPAPIAPERFHVGLHTGILLPQIATALGTALDVEVEGGARVTERLAVVLAVGYSQPTASGERESPQVDPTRYFTSTRQQELTLTVAGQVWFFEANSFFNAAVGLGPRVYFLKTITNGGAGGQPFGENRETSTQLGGVVFGGAEVRLGPGALVGSLELGASNLPHLITGDVSTTALGATVGYRLYF